MKTYAGIDLHSNNNFVGVINDKVRPLALENQLFSDLNLQYTNICFVYFN